MAKRPVFESKTFYPFYSEHYVEFDWVPGLSVSQKKKCVLSLHDAYRKICPDRRILEVSSKSTVPFGVAASAFNLKKFVPSLGRSLPVEVIYQAAKVFEKRGPYLDLYNVSPREAKQDERLKNSGKIIAFHFEGKDYPIMPGSIFYNWLYVNALLENEDLLDQICEYDAFTDIEYNPQRGIACQARALAIAVGLRKVGLLEKVKDFDDFILLMTKPLSIKIAEPVSDSKLGTIPSVAVGTKLNHVTFRHGEVIAVQGDRMIVRFVDGEEKKLSISFSFCNKLVEKC